MAHYLYDGTFEGFLTCIHHHYYKEKAEAISLKKLERTTFLYKKAEVKTDHKLAKVVYQAIKEKISSKALHYCYVTFLSNTPSKEMAILEFLKLGFKKGSDTLLLHGNPTVKLVEKTYKKVYLEMHRFLGLLRFAEVGTVLYAKFQPDHAILELVAPHFADRNNDPSIIHDLNRNTAAFISQGKWFIQDFHLDETVNYSENEEFFQELWKIYFNDVSIRERINPKLQQNFVPKKYRQHLLEFDS